ncbi:Methionine-R-sulfoxide reductase B1, partial [Fragariocoptes setiger]
MTSENINKSFLSPLQYKVTQQKYTERPHTGRFDKFFQKGIYECIVCGQMLFASSTKFDSGCGWPAFFDCIDSSKITMRRDDSLATDTSSEMAQKYHLIRTEIVCSKCNSHLGHVFDDGPKPTKRRYCVNSASMRFRDPEGGIIVDEGDEMNAFPDKAGTSDDR